MENVYFKGSVCHTNGSLPRVGDKAPSFNLVSPKLTEVSSSDFLGKRVVLNIFPSLDTSVCAMAVRQFNKRAARLDNTVVICVSMDLPFAAARFCSAEGIENVLVASAFRSPLFAQVYGVQLIDGVLAGLLTRAIVVYDETRQVIYTQLVNEITDEPDYESALNVLDAT